MQLLKQMVLSAALAAAVAALLPFVFARWWKSANRCAGAVAIGAGYVAGHVLAAGWSPFPPRHATHWLFWFAVIGVIAAVADALVRPKGTVRLVAWAIICTIACRLMLQPKFSYAWSAAEGWLRVFAIALAIVVLTFCLDLVERSPFGTARLFSVTTVLCGGTSAALILSGSLLLGQLACILSTTVATCFLLIIAVRASFHPSGAAAPLSLVCAGLLLSGFFYAELPTASALLLALAPTMALLRVGKKSHSQSRVLAYRAALVAVPVAIAFVLALHASPPLDY
jgi:MFS family permease